MKLFVRLVEAFSSLMFAAWLFLPVSAPRIPEPGLLTGQDLLGLWGLAPGVTIFFLAFAVFRLGSLAIPGRWAKFSGPSSPAAAGLWFLSSLAMVLGTLAPLYLWGSSPDWFQALPVTAWVFLGLGTGANVCSLALITDLVNLRNPIFREYRDFIRRTKKQVIPGSTWGAAVDRVRRIRGKLLMAFTVIFVVILVVLSSVLLSNYQASILKAVGDGAKAQVAQATSVYKANLGSGSSDGSQEAIAMFDFLNAQNRVNAGSAYPFRSFVFYTDLKSKFLLDRKGAGTYPDFKVEYSSKFKDSRYPSAPGLPGRAVASLLDKANADGLYDTVSGTYSYAAPILKNDFEKLPDGTKARHDQLLGLAVITFDEAVILAPYVQTRTEVLILTGLFLYFALVLVYIVGNLIVYPLLFLRMNVRNVSAALQTMVRGDSRISAANLRFEDSVTSRDEIKSLSGEISDMVTVIKGIIPYISASTLRQAETGTASSQEKDLTFLFTDIRGFTSLCEGRAPGEVVTLLNRYLDLEAEIILANNGDIDKFVGDEVMAFFDGPQKEFNACRAAMQIRKAMYEERNLRKNQGLPAVDIGIGINSGRVVFGSVGARDRMDFTSIGDTVNLAARLEGANKAYGSKSIVSEMVYKEIKDQFACRELDLMTVLGKQEPIRIYELLQEKDQTNEKVLSLARTFEEGLAAYRTRDWSKAASKFDHLVEKFQDGPSKVFGERVRFFEKNPPSAGWDGVFRLESK